MRERRVGAIKFEEVAPMANCEAATSFKEVAENAFLWFLNPVTLNEARLPQLSSASVVRLSEPFLLLGESAL